MESKDRCGHCTSARRVPAGAPLGCSLESKDRCGPSSRRACTPPLTPWDALWNPKIVAAGLTDSQFDPTRNPGMLFGIQRSLRQSPIGRHRPTWRRPGMLFGIQRSLRRPGRARTTGNPDSPGMLFGIQRSLRQRHYRGVEVEVRPAWDALWNPEALLRRQNQCPPNPRALPPPRVNPQVFPRPALRPGGAEGRVSVSETMSFSEGRTMSLRLLYTNLATAGSASGPPVTSSASWSWTAAA